jgi:hypothetical protein
MLLEVTQSESSENMDPCGTGCIAGIVVTILVAVVGIFVGTGSHKYIGRRRGLQMSMFIDNSAGSTPDSQAAIGADAVNHSPVDLYFEVGDGTTPEPLLPDVGAHHVEGLSPEALDKFICPELRIGKPEDAKMGLDARLRINSKQRGEFLVKGLVAIEEAIGMNGTAEDQRNLKQILEGTLRQAHPTQKTKTIENIMKEDVVADSKLEKSHVVALRLYTTSTFKSINDALRDTHATGPNPFAAIVIFAAEGIMQLRDPRYVGGETSFWRGMTDVKASKEFIEQGGSELGFMSTSRDQTVAVDFANGGCPMVIEVVVNEYLERGADISFLSQFPLEKEILYPPLTYLKHISSSESSINGKKAHVFRVKPIIA